MTSNLSSLEQNFKELILQRCRVYELDKNPDFKFPKIAKDLLEPDTQVFVTIPGMLGGFTYYLEETDGKHILYAEQSSRMDHSSDDYLYFEITESGSQMLEGEERETVRRKFWELAKKAHEEHLRKLKEAREQYEPSERK